jgi:hypothetical protein
MQDCKSYDLGNTLISFQVQVAPEGGFTIVLEGDRTRWKGTFPKLSRESLDQVASALSRNVGLPMKPLLVAQLNSVIIQFAQLTLVIGNSYD